MWIAPPISGCLVPPLILPSIQCLDPSLPDVANSGPYLGQCIFLTISTPANYGLVWRGLAALRTALAYYGYGAAEVWRRPGVVWLGPAVPRIRSGLLRLKYG